MVVARQAVVTRRIGASSCCDAGRTGGFPSRRRQDCKTGSRRSCSSARTERRANARSCLIATFRLFKAMGPSGRSRTATMGPAAHQYSLTTSLRRGERTEGMSAGHRAVGLRDRRTGIGHEEERSRARLAVGPRAACSSSNHSTALVRRFRSSMAGTIARTPAPVGCPRSVACRLRCCGRRHLTRPARICISQGRAVRKTRCPTPRRSPSPARSQGAAR